MTWAKQFPHLLKVTYRRRQAATIASALFAPLSSEAWASQSGHWLALKMEESSSALLPVQCVRHADKPVISFFYSSEEGSRRKTRSSLCRLQKGQGVNSVVNRWLSWVQTRRPFQGQPEVEILTVSHLERHSSNLTTYMPLPTSTPPLTPLLKPIVTSR